jgi:TetR/AcrR family transcriptional regulator, transcriptional repressor for nem operon
MMAIILMASDILASWMMSIIYTLSMGHSQTDKEKSHREIVRIAAARMREAGTDGPGVAEIMGAAGLTHGGFYKHFGSRDELVAEAVEEAAAQGRAKSDAVLAGSEEPLKAFVDWYLSAGHRDDPANGCAVVAFGADAARGDERVRAAYRDQVEHYIDNVQTMLGGDEGSRAEAIDVVTSMVGALLISRAVDDADLSEEILATVRANVESAA